MSEIEGKPMERQYVLHWPTANAATAEPAAFPTLSAAITALMQQEAACLGDGHTAALPAWEIACQLPGPGSNSRARPQRVFHVNARAVGSGGEGTEESPWWGLATAVEQLSRREQLGQLSLRAGQSVRLVHREVFTATLVERTKKVKENIARFVFLLTALVLIVPMAAILTYLLVRAWPALSWSFIVDNPHDYMTAGGISGAAGGDFFPGLDLVAGRRAGGRAGRRLSQ